MGVVPEQGRWQQQQQWWRNVVLLRGRGRRDGGELQRAPLFPQPHIIASSLPSAQLFPFALTGLRGDLTSAACSTNTSSCSSSSRDAAPAVHDWVTRRLLTVASCQPSKQQQQEQEEGVFGKIHASFKSPWWHPASSPPLSSSSSSGWHEEKSAKEYDIRLKPLWLAFRPIPLVTTAVRCLALSYAPLLEQMVPEIEEEFEDDEEDDGGWERSGSEGDEEEGGVGAWRTKKRKGKKELEKPPLDFVKPAWHALHCSVREVVVSTVRRVVEMVVVGVADPRTAWKLTKDTLASTQRKMRRGVSGFSLIAQTSVTTFRGNVLGCAAAYIVQAALELYHAFPTPPTPLLPPQPPLATYSSPSSSKPSQWLRWLQRAQLRLVAFGAKCGIALAFASAGAGVGLTLTSRRLGYTVGFTLGDMAGAAAGGVIIDPVVRRLLARIP